MLGRGEHAGHMRHALQQFIILKGLLGVTLMVVQVHNALGFAYFNMERTELALKNYARAVELQPGYVTAWNNLGDAQEKAKDWQKVLLLPPVTLVTPF